eukprot:gb/GFBE01032258.1/.p1 GENE.gb/GFBE01032258.1/~~gb/GFBE01032258.1/.p1  ORF type:complete len:482 (+),score=86.43 gb/GFBE01032258.1/:1-1446(+)
MQPLAEGSLPRVAGDEEHCHGREDSNPILDGMEAPWANDKFFAADLLGMLLLAVIVGVASCGYNYVVADLLEKWLSASGAREYPRDPDSIQLMGGAPVWILLVWAGCTGVGVLKWAIGLDKFPSFLQEIRTEHAEPSQCFKVCLCCMASLLSGAALGPEAGLASGGAGTGVLIARGISKLGPDFERDADDRRRLFVLGGIVAAFGSIMPAPWVALLICVECALQNRNQDKELVMWGRRTLFLMSFCGSLSFVVKYWVVPVTELPPFGGPTLDDAYDDLMPIKAILLGAIAAFSALVYFIIGAITKVIFTKIGSGIERCAGKGARIVALCSLAGLITGVLGYLVPLSLTDGKAGMAPTIHHGPSLTAANLFAIAISKTVSFSVAASGGLVGGPFFPVLYIGLVVGELVSRIPGLGLFPNFCVPVVMVSLPGAVFPVPFTMVAFPVSGLKLGPLWCVPLLVSVSTAYTLLVGTGLVKKLAGRR